MPKSPDTPHLDSYDRKMLALLQADGSLGPAELSTRVNLSASQCSRRLQRLREQGLIAHTVAILDRDALNLGISAFLLIRLGSHAPQNEQKFVSAVEVMPEVVSCHYTTGDLDFILNVVTRDLASYDALLRRILGAAEISSCRSNLVLRTAKSTTAVTLNFA